MDNFSLLASNNSDFKVTLLESLLVNREHLSLNKNRHLVFLELFVVWGRKFFHMISVGWSYWSPFILHKYFFIKWVIFWNFKQLYVKFSFTTSSLRMTVVSVKMLKKWRKWLELCRFHCILLASTSRIPFRDRESRFMRQIFWGKTFCVSYYGVFYRITNLRNILVVGFWVRK